MPAPFPFRSTIERLWRHRSEHGMLSLLSAGGAMLASLRLSDVLMDEAMASGSAVSSITPVAVGAVSAFALASRHSGNDDLAPIARMMRALRPGSGTGAVFRSVLEELLRLADAREAIVAVEKVAGRRLLMATLGTDEEAPNDVALKRIPRSARATYFFSWPEAGLEGHAPPAPMDPQVRVVLLDREAPCVPAALMASHPCESMFVISFVCSDDWHGRLILLDPRTGRSQAFIRTFELLLSHLMPAVAGVCDLHALRRRAASHERARLARELHDSVVQDLVNIDVELELVKRRDDADWDTVKADLARVQEQVRSQVTGLRALVQQARSHDGTSSRLPALLAEVVQRFGRESGIEAEYQSSVANLHLPARVCAEIVRIVQEALVNVRRHSGARHVTVDFASGPDDLTLGIQDDGRGFAAPAPAILNERVQSIGGTVYVLALDRGARVEVRLPRNGPWTTTTRSESLLPTTTRFSGMG
jgi:signal transduction histidine kinase